LNQWIAAITAFNRTNTYQKQKQSALSPCPRLGLAIGSQSALHYRSIQNRFLKPQFGFKIPLNSINRQVQDRQFTDYPLSEVVTPSWRSEPEATWQLISPILRLKGFRALCR